MPRVNGQKRCKIKRRPLNKEPPRIPHCRSQSSFAGKGSVKRTVLISKQLNVRKVPSDGSEDYTIEQFDGACPRCSNLRKPPAPTGHKRAKLPVEGSFGAAGLADRYRRLGSCISTACTGCRGRKGIRHHHPDRECGFGKTVFVRCCHRFTGTCSGNS